MLDINDVKSITKPNPGIFFVGFNYTFEYTLVAGIPKKLHCCAQFLKNL